MTDNKENKKPDVTVIVINFVKDLAKDYFKKIIFAGVTGLAIWGWTSWKTSMDERNEIIMNMPKKYERLLEIRTADSLWAIKQLREERKRDSIQDINFADLKHKFDSAVYAHAMWLQNDLDSIIAINKKLTKHKIK